MYLSPTKKLVAFALNRSTPLEFEYAIRLLKTYKIRLSYVEDQMLFAFLHARQGGASAP